MGWKFHVSTSALPMTMTSLVHPAPPSQQPQLQTAANNNNTPPCHGNGSKVVMSHADGIPLAWHGCNC